MANGESGAWKRVGADGLMERARSISPCVKMSAAKRRTRGKDVRGKDCKLKSLRTCVTIDSSVLKINSSSAIGTDDDLEL